MRIRFVALAVVVVALPLIAQDPAATNPTKYKVILENERVRVLEYRDHPGEKTTLHHHPDSVLYALSAFKRRLVFPDGTSTEREFKPGDVLFLKDQRHIGENIGHTDTAVVLFELKEPRPAPASAATPPQ